MTIILEYTQRNISVTKTLTISLCPDFFASFCSLSLTLLLIPDCQERVKDESQEKAGVC